MLINQSNDLFSSEKRSYFISLSRAYCEQLWAEHKYLAMLTSYRLYKEISQALKEQVRLTRETGNRDWTEFAHSLVEKLEEVKTADIDEDNARNALSHVFGHLRGKVSLDESGAWHVLLANDWQEAWKVLFILVMERGDDYLKRSRLFSPNTPVSHTWLRVRGKDWFVRQNEGNFEVYTPQEVAAEIVNCKVANLISYRLLAQLNDVTNPLTTYEQFFHTQKIAAAAEK